MEKIKLITDSTSDLTPELIEKYDIHVLPLTVHIGSQSFKDGESISLEEMYQAYVPEQCNDEKLKKSVESQRFSALFS